MKMQSKFISAIALTLAIGGVLIAGNAAIAARTAAAGAETENQAAISNEKPATTEPVTAISSVKPEAVEQAASISNAKTDTAEQVTAIKNATPETAEIFTTMKTLPNGATVIVANGEVTVDAPSNGNDTAYSFYYNSDSGVFDVIERSDILGPYVEGQPGGDDIEKEAAVSVAVKSITDKYALKQTTLDKFYITATYYSTYEDISGAVWFINLNPINAGDFSEIGCYTAVLNAETGDVLRLLSAADGKG